MGVQPTDLQQLNDGIMIAWPKFSEKCFKHVVESVPRILKACLKPKGVKPSTSRDHCYRGQPQLKGLIYKAQKT